MKPNLYRKDWYFNPNCPNCMNNHDKLEALREELQQLKQDNEFPDYICINETTAKLSIDIDEILGTKP